MLDVINVYNDLCLTSFVDHIFVRLPIETGKAIEETGLFTWLFESVSNDLIRNDFFWWIMTYFSSTRALSVGSFNREGRRYRTMSLIFGGSGTRGR